MNAPPKKNKNALILIGLAIGAMFIGLTVCALGAVAVPAFMRYQRKAKATEAKATLGKIAASARAHFEEGEPGSCQFPPPSAEPLPPLLECCEDVCRREESQTRDPAWQAVGLNTAEMHRFQYETVSSDRASEFVIRASADLDCDGVRSAYEIAVTASSDEGACVAEIGAMHIEQEIE